MWRKKKKKLDQAEKILSYFISLDSVVRFILVGVLTVLSFTLLVIQFFSVGFRYLLLSRIIL